MLIGKYIRQQLDISVIYRVNILFLWVSQSLARGQPLPICNTTNECEVSKMSKKKELTKVDNFFRFATWIEPVITYSFRLLGVTRKLKLS